ncbi:MAG TPA: SpoIIE family protein phosphatase [Pyrinomonadaceae bacterium]|jgi:sigma-B regulation protein RsbU (phosphoserine phosphatase)
MSAHTSESARILIADDQPDVLEALRLLLRRNGYIVETVSSPAAVLEALKLRSFDTLLIDLNYARDTTSGREGIELLSRVQALDNALPTVVMTGWASIEVAVEAMRHGAREFVQKPWDNEQLLALLRRQVSLCKLLRRKQQAEVEKRREAEMAAEAQRRLLPQHAPASDRLEFFAVCQPAREVGGDYYDFIELERQQTGFVIADVEGKGMSAALFASAVQATVRSQARREHMRPASLMASVNEHFRTCADATSYATLFYAEIDEASGALTYVNAGHNPPLLLSKRGASLAATVRHEAAVAITGQRVLMSAGNLSTAIADEPVIQRLEAGGPVIGFFEDCVYEEATVRLESGDVMVAYTDGLTESFNMEGEEFGEQRLSELLLENQHLTATALGEKILETVRRWCSTAPLHDDLTLVIMKMK